jgi:chemotaxis protein histidine kinase CheA
MRPSSPPGGPKRRTVAGLLGALALLLLACAETTLTPQTPPAVPVVTSAALQPTLEQAQVDLYLDEITAQRRQRDAQATLEHLYALQTATAVAQAGTATAQSQQSTATATAQQATATHQVWQVTLEAAYAQGTATAAAAATATAYARELANATATAEANRAALAAHQTATAWQSTRTVAEADYAATATVRSEQLERARLETRHAALVYPLRTYGLWVLGVLAAALLLWGGYRLLGVLELRLQAVQRDARGDAPLIPVRLPGGGLVWYDPDRSFGPAVVVDAAGQVTQPALPPPELQAPVTARDQALDLAHRGLPRPQASRRRRVSPAQAARLLAPSPYRILSPEEPPPPQLVDGEVLHVLDADWREEDA